MRRLIIFVSQKEKYVTVSELSASEKKIIVFLSSTIKF